MSDETKPAAKTERLHMLMSAPELDAIDDWRFNNRVKNRSEAIRRLCQIGLALEHSAQSLDELAEKYMYHAEIAFKGKKSLFESAPKPVQEWIEKSFVYSAAMVADVSELHSAIEELKDGATVEDAMKAAQKEKDEVAKIMKDVRDMSR